VGPAVRAELISGQAETRVLTRIPRWAGTTLLVAGLAGAAVCYLAVGAAIRREQACADAEPVATLAAQCIANAAFWREVAIIGFVAALAVSMVGLIIDRLQGWMIRAARRRGRTGG